jgi:glutamate-5-semialdehyde dehydrogenase
MKQNNNYHDVIEKVCVKARALSEELAVYSNETKVKALNEMAQALDTDIDELLTANKLDIEKAKEKKLSTSLIDRLLLNKERVKSIVQAIKNIAAQPDPVGEKLSEVRVDSGLRIARYAVPLGVIAIIYESRPNVTADAAALCLKSGNAVILRGGSECLHTNKAMLKSLRKGLSEAGLPPDIIQYVPIQDRAAVNVLLAMDNYIDVVIPRGGKSLIQAVRDNSTIPVLSHLDGLCHTYIHDDADKKMAADIVINAKMRRPGICGATETLLVSKKIAKSFLPPIISSLIEKGCEIRGDEFVRALNSNIEPASQDDWSTEYLDAILSIKTVDSIEDAISHINTYGSGHTDAIITESDDAAQKFKRYVKSAIAMHNCSTQFADGGEFGMGAEIGVATGKLHARGPVGLKELTTYQYFVKGNGQTRA